MRGVPRERPAISENPALVNFKSSMPAERRNTSSSSPTE